MKIKHYPLWCFLFLTLFLVSCAGTHKIKAQKVGCTSKVAEAIKKINSGKSGTAKIILEDVKLQCAGHEIMDTAEYYLGVALMNLKFYAEAKLEFSRLTQDFPNSPFFDESLYMIALSVYKTSRPVDRDQAETKEALKLLRDFVETYPSSFFADSAQKYMARAVDKLAEKDFNSARFYQKVGEKEAAVICYKSFINDYAGSSFVAQARLNLGQLLIELGRKSEAKEVLDDLVAKETNGDYVKKAHEMLGRLKESN
jgi:outer membrane protein assembly factor BamD